jgi:UDP-N-acetylglucosamine--N-acetylmuramyl-(pentapeptide) pyrophosphoryl-undecaprenol N-acetylglucosamine transferase
VFPALAVADELEKREWRVSFAGTAQGPEARLAVAHGLEFHPLPASAFRGRGMGARIRSVLTLLRSSWSARGLLRHLEASVVVATGGYVSMPAALAAWSLRRPVILVEPNASAGLANRFLSRFAWGAAVAWGSLADELRCAVHETGVPVRQAFFDIEPPAARKPFRLLVLGGSQGAVSLNETVPEALGLLLDGGGPELEVLHQAGRGKEVTANAAYAATEVKAEVVGFLDDVPKAMATSDLVLSRAGAITLAEISAAGRASMLFPLPLAGAHQEHNARAFESAGAARVLTGSELDAEELRLHLHAMLRQDELSRMGSAARSLARPGAAAAIVDLLEEATR